MHNCSSICVHLCCSLRLLLYDAVEMGSGAKKAKPAATNPAPVVATYVRVKKPLLVQPSDIVDVDSDIAVVDSPIADIDSPVTSSTTNLDSDSTTSTALSRRVAPPSREFVKSCLKEESYSCIGCHSLDDNYKMWSCRKSCGLRYHGNRFIVKGAKLGVLFFHDVRLVAVWFLMHVVCTCVAVTVLTVQVLTQKRVRGVLHASFATVVQRAQRVARCVQAGFAASVYYTLKRGAVGRPHVLAVKI